MSKVRRNQYAYLFGDVMCCFAAVAAALLLRFDREWTSVMGMPQVLIFGVLASASVVITGTILGSYKSLWQHFGFADMLRQLYQSVISAFVILMLRIAANLIMPGQREILISVSALIIYCGIQFGLSTLIRAIPRGRKWYICRQELKKCKMQRTVIIGAGAAGAMVVKRIRENTNDGFTPVAIVDDDEQKQGTSLSGVPVSGRISDIDKVVKKFAAEIVIIAIPSADAHLLNRIYENCRKANIPVKIFPSMLDVKNFMRFKQHSLRDISIEDLLFRDAIKTDMTDVINFIKDKTVLVTGGAGSIGSEICRQVLQYGCKKLIVFDIHENGLFELGEELKEKFSRDRYVLCMGTVRDSMRLDRVFTKYQPDFVFHAAAHKHVPLMEENPIEAVKNNIFGTKKVMEACQLHGVKKFVLISTDKAVNPANIMGATKRIAEMMVQSMNGPCEMTAVRFGNVLGSNGSVIPTFKKQIQAGGPVTVTDKNITRYFMTIPEAVSLVLSAGAQAKGGDIFVLDMGKPIRIYDLAVDMIKLSGLVPGKDIEIKVTGLRAGEKMYEELSLEHENVTRTQNEKVFVMQGHPWDLTELNERLNKLLELIKPQTQLETVYEEVFAIINEDKEKTAQLDNKIINTVSAAKMGTTLAGQIK